MKTVLDPPTYLELTTFDTIKRKLFLIHLGFALTTRVFFALLWICSRFPKSIVKKGGNRGGDRSKVRMQ